MQVLQAGRSLFHQDSRNLIFSVFRKGHTDLCKGLRTAPVSDSHRHAGPVTTGNGSAQGAGVSGTSQGQAAIAWFKEHVAIPTAIAAATVSFLIVIFTSLCYGLFTKNPKNIFKKQTNTRLCTLFFFINITVSGYSVGLFDYGGL